MSISKPLKKSYKQNSDRKTDWRLFLRLVPYARSYKKLLAASMLLLIPVAVANAVQPLIVGQVISLIRKEPNTYDFLIGNLQQGLLILQIIFLITVVIKLLLTGFQGYLVQKVGQKITADIRKDLFQHVTSLAVRFFDKTPVGKLITRLTSDVEVLGDVFATGAVGIFADIFSTLVIIGFMFYTQWQLALLLLLLLFPVSALITFFQQQFRKANYKVREELSVLNSQLQENITGINVVQLFRREKFNAQLFEKTNNRYVKEVDVTIFHDSAVSATLEWIALVAIAGVLLIGGWLILGEQLTVGILATFILYAQRLFDPLRQFAEKFTIIQTGFTAIERVSDILDEPIEIRDKVNPRYSLTNKFEFGYIEEIVENLETNNKIDPSKLGEIRFEQVWFAYKDDDYVIKNLDFTIKPGEKIALVGPQEPGKVR